MQLESAIVPRKIMPMLATSSAPFDDPGYLFETKWDGARGMVAVPDGRLRIWGRDGHYTGTTRSSGRRRPVIPCCGLAKWLEPKLLARFDLQAGAPMALGVILCCSVGPTSVLAQRDGNTI